MQPHAPCPARRAGGDVDDPSPPPRPHVRQYRLGAQEGGFQVDRDGLIEIGLGQVVDPADQRDARVVDQDVHPAQQGADRLHHAGNGIRLRHIRRHRDRLPPERPDPGRNILGLLGAGPVVDRDIRPGLRQGARDGSADPAGPAGDQRHPSGQVRIHASAPCCGDHTS
ncbi:MAG TPA: hypothetical protein VE690_24090 [Rhodopila sp.]|nr:hypothetical protein [Rhodopila sp.]